MNIRKHWKKICLAVAALFWAGCNEDNGTEPRASAESSSSVEQNNESFNADSSINSSSSSPEAYSSSDESTKSSTSAWKVCEDASMYSKEGPDTSFLSSGVSSDIFQTISYRVSDTANTETCGDTTTYPLVMAGTVIRCNIYQSNDSYSFTVYLHCCDSQTREWDQEDIKNDTLYTDSLLKIRRMESFSETYCTGNGGVTDFKVYRPSDLEISDSDCDDLAKQKALEKYADSTGDTVVYSVKACMHMMSEYGLLYGVTPRDTTTDPVAQLTCADSTVITVEEYTALLESYNQKMNCCEAQAEGYREQAAECFKQQ